MIGKLLCLFLVVPRPVACFRGADNLEEELGDFRSEIKLGTDPYDVVEKCAVLAYAKQYKMFALGKDGLSILKTNTISIVRRMERTVKTVSAKEIVCSFIP